MKNNSGNIRTYEHNKIQSENYEQTKRMVNFRDGGKG